MGLIIFSVILTIGVIITLWLNDFGAYSLLGILCLGIILFGCFTNIGANTVGIMYNPFKGRNTK